MPADIFRPHFWTCQTCFVCKLLSSYVVALVTISIGLVKICLSSVLACTHPVILYTWSCHNQHHLVQTCILIVFAGTHAEGGIWATLFGLLMWDVLFMDVPDVFQTAFQTAPLDLGTIVFYPTRQDAIESRLTQIRGGEAIRLLQHCWQQHLGEWCRGVNWDRHSTLRPQLLTVCCKGRTTFCRRGWSLPNIPCGTGRRKGDERPVRILCCL